MPGGARSSRLNDPLFRPWIEAKLDGVSDHRDTIIAWSAGVSVVAATFAGILASRATTSLSQNAWFIGCVVFACAAFAILLVAGLTALPSLWRSRQLESAQEIETKRDAVDVIKQTGGLGKSLPRVRDVRDRALLGIHPAIPLPSEASTLSREFPLYVPRDIDPELDEWIANHRESGGFLLLVGPAAAGKTRTAYELIQRTVGDWQLFMPGTAVQLAEYIESTENTDNLVIWLNEIQNFLGPVGLESGLVRRVLADTRPALLIGTIWPDRYEVLTEQPSGSELTDPSRDAREILGILADRKDLLANFTADEYQRARVLAKRDPRIDEVVRHGDHGQLAAMLAAAPELVRRWVTATNPYGAAILSAAVFARLCGHPALLPEAVFKSLASCFLTSEQRARLSDDHWFSNALVWCRQPVRGNVMPLIPQSEVIGKIDGDFVSDVLVQHGRSDIRITSQLASESSWLHLIESASPDACAPISLVALLRPGPPRAFEEAGRKAAEAGDIPSMLNMGTVLYERGDTAQAEDWFAKAAATGNPVALTHVGTFLVEIGKKPEAEIMLRKAADLKFPPAMDALSELFQDRGDAAEAESWMRRAAVIQYPPAMIRLAILLHYRGEKPEAEDWARKAAQAGNVLAIAFLGIILSERGEKAEAEAWLRKAARFEYPDQAGIFGHPIAMTELGSILLSRGKAEEAELWWRRSANAGEHRAMTYLGTMLKDRGAITEAEKLWRKAAEGGSELSANNLGTLSYEMGNKSEAERWWRKAADAGMVGSMKALATILNERGERAEAEHWWRKAAELNDTQAMNALATLLEERGEEDEAERLWRKSAEAESVDAAAQLGHLYHKRGDDAQAEIWWRRAANVGNTYATIKLAVLLHHRGEKAEAIGLLRPLAEMNDPSAMGSLGAMLNDIGESQEGELWTRKSVEAGNSTAMSNLGAWLLEQGNKAESERLLRMSADLDNPAGMYNLGELLRRRGENAEAEMWRQKAINKEPERDWPEYTD